MQASQGMAGGPNSSLSMKVSRRGSTGSMGGMGGMTPLRNRPTAKESRVDVEVGHTPLPASPLATHHSSASERVSGLLRTIVDRRLLALSCPLMPSHTLSCPLMPSHATRTTRTQVREIANAATVAVQQRREERAGSVIESGSKPSVATALTGGTSVEETINVGVRRSVSR